MASQLRNPARTSFRRRLAGGMLALLFVAPAAGANDDPELAAMIEELSKLNAEIKKVEQEIPAKVKENLSIGRSLQSEAEVVVKHMDHQEATEGKDIDAQRPAVQAACGGGDLPEAVARCRSVAVPFNQKVDAFNAQLEQDKAKLRAIQAKAEKRDKEFKQLLAKRDSLATSVKGVMLRMRLLLVRRCVERAGSSDESAAHAQSVCFDQAEARLAELSGSTAPPSTATPNRTPQQAIDDYRNSGAVQPNLQGRRPAPPPPPPPPQK